MITLGDFRFPEAATECQVSVIEAKSKVRKEIQIRSLLRADSRWDLDFALAALRHAVEAFDKQEAALSLHPGRYYHGRRREFHETPVPAGLAAWIELLVFTLDRYERGATLYAHESTAAFGQGRFSLFHRGNWLAPLFITLEPEAPLTQLQFLTADDFLTLEETLPAGQVITADSEKRELLVQGRNRYSIAHGRFPFLRPGINTLTVRFQPQSAKVRCVIRYRDFWV
ncbi:MAG: hypothetical protein HPY51_11870 [Candidatus Omnitrophica bacterium]|nr:hypothetical protein [Candidatus Omnitrophota bacterium]